MLKVEVNGRSVHLMDAATEGAAVLSAARLPVVAGLGADVAAIRSALLLAERLGGAVDHLASAAVLGDLTVMQRSGWLTVSPGEVSRSCDLLMKVGRDTGEIRLSLPARIFEVSPGDLPILRALTSKRPPQRFDLEAAARLGPIAEALPQARFGVATWSASHLHAAEIEMLMGLVRDLNETTRFSTLPAAASDNGNGAALTCGWMTGFPPRIGFGRGYPEYDPWAFDARRLVESGEADAVLWLSAYRPAMPEWGALVPTVAIVAAGTKLKKAPRVLVEVGSPGVDHDAVEYRRETGALTAIAAVRPSDAPSAAAVLEMIAGALA